MSKTLMRMIALLIAMSFSLGAIADRPLVHDLHASVADWIGILNRGEAASYAIIGDSITFKGDSLNWYLREFLEADYGNAGDGYLALSPPFGHTPNGTSNRRQGLSFRISSTQWVTWGTDSGVRDQFGLRSPDGIYSRVGGPGWIELRFYGPDAILHYVKEQGAGVLRIVVNGKWVMDIDASLQKGAQELATLTFATGQPDPTQLNTVRFSLVGASTNDPQWTQLNGLQMTTGQPGSMYHRLSRGGAGPENFLSADLSIYEASLRAIDPDLLLVMIDPTSNEQFYEEKMIELLDHFEMWLPATEIVLVSHHHFRESRNASTEFLWRHALKNDLGFINLFDLHDDPAHLQSLGFLLDVVHLTGFGGSWFGSYLHDLLVGWRPMHRADVTFGSVVEGDRYELLVSEDDRLLIQSAFGFSAAEPNTATVTTEGTIDHPQPETLTIRFESSANNPGVAGTVQVWNWSDKIFDAPSSVAIQMNDSVTEIGGIPTADHVRILDGVVRVKIKQTAVATFAATGFVARHDHITLRAD